MTFLIGWVSCAIASAMILAFASLLDEKKFTWKAYVEHFFCGSFIYGLIQVWIGN